MSSIYENGTYLDNNSTYHVEDSQWKAQQVVRMMQRNSLSTGTICEIGCGAGEILVQLANHYPCNHYIGYDISPQAYSLCATRARHNIEFRLGDAFEFDTGNQFDIALVLDVIEHVEDCFGFARKVKNKALFKIFHIPLEISVQTVLRSSLFMESRETVGHVHYFTKETALATLTDTGHEILDYFYTKSCLELPDRGWKANMLRYPRKLGLALSEDLTVRILGGFSLMVLTQ